MTTVVKLHVTSSAAAQSRRGVQDSCHECPASKGSKKRTQARAVRRILDKTSGDLVGWLYEWNTGEIVPRWKAGVIKDVYYE